MDLPRGVPFNLQGENAPLIAWQRARLARTFQTLLWEGEKATENALVMDQGQLKVFFPELGQWVVEFHLRFILEKQVPCVLHKNPNIGHSKDIFTHLNKWCARNDETELTFTW